MKRIFDIFFSTLGLICLSPLFLLVSILIKLTSPGPVFFKQERIGKNFRPFLLYKFRTMVPDAAQRGHLITAGDDKRITRIGRILRKTKIDELPQLINVLKGDMSLVGPRPEVRKYVEMYRKDYEEILKIRPGITDIASLKFRNEEELLKGKENYEEYYAHVILPEKIKLAKEYLKKMSLWFDVKLILKTIFSILYPTHTINDTIEKLGPYRQPLAVFIQISLFTLSNYLAFFLRFDGDIPDREIGLFFKYLPLLLFLRTIFLFSFDLHKGLWRYASIQDALSIFYSVTLSSLSFFAIVRYAFKVYVYPRSVYFIDAVLSFLFLSGIRLFRRLHVVLEDAKSYKKRLLIIGAGDAAELLLREIEHSPQYSYQVIGLIDDNPQKKGIRIRGIKVLGTRKDLPHIMTNENPDEVLIAIPSANAEVLRHIVEDIRQYGKPVKIMHGLWQVLSGNGLLSQIKALEPEDLLFRPPVFSRCDELKTFYMQKCIMVTGAGGSIGSELSRQLAQFTPKLLILFEKHEESLYKIDLELKNRFKQTNIVSIIGGVTNKARIKEVMETYRPQIIFHAAAYKHVPLMEYNPSEAFKNNVIGTKTIGEMASQYKVEKFIFISTDKAVNPINIMGMTKKIGELIMLQLSQNSATKYTAVRFGNVLDSSGSVVPLFREQIRKGGPVTVTHPEITRYFMTIPEAVHLVLHATVISQGGEIFVLDMGKPVKILELAKRMIELYGYIPGKDIEVVFTGLRPREKLHEELFNKNERVEKTSHPKILRARPNSQKRAVLEKIEPFLNKEKITKEDLKQLLL